jgi:hypothetical protein
MERFTALLVQGRVLRDKLALSGDHPEIKRKLDHLVDLAYLKGGEAEKLRNLIKAASNAGI